jgi:hypothetical protein
VATATNLNYDARPRSSRPNTACSATGWIGAIFQAASGSSLFPVYRTSTRSSLRLMQAVRRPGKRRKQNRFSRSAMPVPALAGREPLLIGAPLPLAAAPNVVGRNHRGDDSDFGSPTYAAAYGSRTTAARGVPECRIRWRRARLRPVGSRPRCSRYTSPYTPTPAAEQTHAADGGIGAILHAGIVSVPSRLSAVSPARRG